MNDLAREEALFERISSLIEQGRKKVATTINQEMVVLYWNIGKTIKEEIIKSDRAEYGEGIVQSLTAQYTVNNFVDFLFYCYTSQLKLTLCI